MNVLTANYGNDRTNANLNETILTPAGVQSGTFGKLFVCHVDEQVFAQPLYVSGVEIPGQGVHNVIYVATMNNSIYAFDADSGPAAPLWHVQFGTPVDPEDYSEDGTEYTDILDAVGILSTPVIDLAGGTIYAVTNNCEQDTYSYVLHALDIATGQEKSGGPARIQASVPGTGGGSDRGTLGLDPFQHLQRPGLLLLNGVVYVAFGSHADGGIYHGWVVAYSAANVQEQVGAFSVTPDGWAGSIWQAGHGIAADDAGNLYAVTANGDYDGITNFGQSFIKLDPSLRVIDWFTPDNWSDLSAFDQDLGACGAALIPGTGLLVGGSKSGTVYVLDSGNMGRLQEDDAGAVQSFQAVGSQIFDLAVWNRTDGPIMYLQGFGEPLKAYRMSNGQFETLPFTQGGDPASLPYAGLAISANGGTPGTGILWMTSSTGDTQPSPGILHAFDASDLSRELWNSSQTPEDSLGMFTKFVAPTVANGKVYVPTLSRQLVVYGLKSSPQSPRFKRTSGISGRLSEPNARE